MMKAILKKMMWAVVLLVSMLPAKAASDVEMADGLYQSGKIYVVVICIAIIFLGLAAYLFLLDRKIRKFENE